MTPLIGFILSARVSPTDSLSHLSPSRRFQIWPSFPVSNLALDSLGKAGQIITVGFSKPVRGVPFEAEVGHVSQKL